MSAVIADGHERRRVLLLLRQYGWNATSFQVLEQGFQYWFCGDDACVAYVDTGNSWVAAGAPITGAERLGEVAQAFVAAAAQAGRRASFFAVERRFIDMPPLQVTLIGEQPVWNPARWAALVEGHRSLWLGVARVLSASFYDFRGVQTFRAKLRPDRWNPIYLVYPSAGRPAVFESSAALWDVLTAFARGRLVSSEVETLLRGPALVIRLLALLLVPWTILLSLVSVQLFPSSAVRAAWVAFDAALTLALFTLAARWRRWLGVAVATAVSLDAITTALQVAFFNLERVSGPFEAIALAIAIGAPMVAALIL